MNPKNLKKKKEQDKTKKSEPNWIDRYKIDIFIPLIIALSLINSLRAAASRYYIISYADDIGWVYWASEHISQPLTLLSQGWGNGYRPVINILYGIGYALWGANEAYYYLLNGIFFAGSMVFLYCIIKLISDRLSAIIAVLLYLFLDSSFILVWKMNYITSIAEMFFITASLYYSIHYFEKSDKKSLVPAALFAIFAFFSKEQSIIIIPLVNITYILYKWKGPAIGKKAKILAIMVNLVPILVFYIAITFLSPDVAISKSTSLIELAKTRLSYYIEQELTWQFKNQYLIFLGCIGAFFFHQFKQEKFGGIRVSLIKNAASVVLILAVFISSQYGNLDFISALLILLLALSFIIGDTGQRVGLAWFAAGFAPLLFVSLGPVQPTYLAEPNMGMVMFIGITVSKYVRYIFSSGYRNPEQKSDDSALLHVLGVLNVIIVILILLAQLPAVSSEIENTNNYHKMMSDIETSFKESIEYLKANVPENGVIYYIPQEQHDKFGGQINSDSLHSLLCLKGRCDIQIKSLSSLNIEETRQKNEYIALISNLDMYIFSNEYKPLLRNDLYKSQKQIKNGENQALILGLRN
ncbi:Dolichyl-phosphate-mannose-protein mannosyltransferase [uncultured archaeon]|nr:Dolichyl-phosphate-mannose-protein mannosyltransferase [uncultured archaeon]